MLPELFKLQRDLSERLDFKLRLAGLQVGGQAPLKDADAERLIELWQHVAETTGQEFAFKLPADTSFVYHSELACRTLHIAKSIHNEEPWLLFEQMQRAFYTQCANLADLDVLFNLIATTGVDQTTFENLIRDDEIVDATRREIDWCQQLGTTALPSVYLDIGDGPKLICGGYATHEFLLPDILHRLTTH